MCRDSDVAYHQRDWRAFHKLLRLLTLIHYPPYHIVCFHIYNAPSVSLRLLYELSITASNERKSF